MILSDEQRDYVVLTGSSLFGGCCQRLVECLVRLVIRQCFDNIGNRYFKNDVHTAL